MMTAKVFFLMQLFHIFAKIFTKMNHQSKIYFFVFVFISSLLSAQNFEKDALKIISIAKEDNQTMQHLDILTNRIGGRILGSSAYESAVQWTAAQFRAWGLAVEVIEVGELPIGFNRGSAYGKMLSEGGMILHFATPSYTVGTKGVQKGHVLAEPKTQADFDRMKMALKGAWVLIGGKNEGYPIDWTKKGDEERQEMIEKNETIAVKNNERKKWNRENRDSIPKELEELIEAPALFYRQMVDAGILGIIQSASIPIQAMYDRKSLDSMTFSHLPSVPDIKLDEHQYKVIAQHVNERRNIELEIEIRNHFRPGPIKYHNVIATLKGTRFPNEYIIKGGHLDSYDMATGAVDCGTGVITALEVARLIAISGIKPKRTLMFCLWAGEEFGLLGSKHWVETNQDKWKGIINYFNRDGGPTASNMMTVPPGWYSIMEPICEPLNKINPEIPFTLATREGEPPEIPKNAGGSDHAYFAMNGIPTLPIRGSDPLGYNFSYHEIWHTERDIFNKSIPLYMEHSSVVEAIILLGMANTQEKFPLDEVYKTDAFHQSDTE
jgi:hypothetical protein